MVLLDQLNGLPEIIRRGDKVLLKPNMLSAKAPEQAITTHPFIVQAVAEYILAFGARPSIGDSPGGAVKNVCKYWDATGLTNIAKYLDIPLLSFETSGMVERKVGQWSFHVAQPVMDADVVINLPKCKTHSFMLLTGAIKNMYGILPGWQKARFHSLAPKPRLFNQLLVDVFSVRPPELTVMDAVVGMEGNGPSAGKPRMMGYLLASQDAVALDAVAATMMGYRINQVGYLRMAELRGLGVARLEAIDLIGEVPQRLKIPGFKLPSNFIYHLIPESLGKLRDKIFWMRPVADPGRCTLCGQCIKSCPVQAMQSNGRVPIIDYEKCINCLCCEELCPEKAILQERSRLVKLILRN